MKNAYAIYYRTGGTMNFKWQRAANQNTVEEARQMCESLKNMGYPAHYDLASRIDTIGLPETFE